MKFKNYYSKLSRAEKDRLAMLLRTSVPYLSQLASGHRKAGAKIVLQIESATNGAVLAEELRADLYADQNA